MDLFVCSITVFKNIQVLEYDRADSLLHFECAWSATSLNQSCGRFEQSLQKSYLLKIASFVLSFFCSPRLSSLLSPPPLAPSLPFTHFLPATNPPVFTRLNVSTCLRSLDVTIYTL